MKSQRIGQLATLALVLWALAVHLAYAAQFSRYLDVLMRRYHWPF